jgi:hypothetical protein
MLRKQLDGILGSTFIYKNILTCTNFYFTFILMLVLLITFPLCLREKIIFKTGNVTDLIPTIKIQQGKQFTYCMIKAANLGSLG